MRFEFIKPLAATILLCVAAELCAFGGLVACDLAHAIGEHRVVLHPVAVTVDDGMLEIGAYF